MAWVQVAGRASYHTRIVGTCWAAGDLYGLAEDGTLLKSTGGTGAWEKVVNGCREPDSITPKIPSVLRGPVYFRGEIEIVINETPFGGSRGSYHASHYTPGVSLVWEANWINMGTSGGVSSNQQFLVEQAGVRAAVHQRNGTPANSLSYGYDSSGTQLWYIDLLYSRDIYPTCGCILEGDKLAHGIPGGNIYVSGNGGILGRPNLPVGNESSAMVDFEGELWIGTTAGKIYKSNTSFDPPSLVTQFPNAAITALKSGPDGKLYIGLSTPSS